MSAKVRRVMGAGKSDMIVGSMNVDAKTVQGFGEEWSTFTQSKVPTPELESIFNQYFSLIDWSEKPLRALDFGCGSGRWSALVAPRVQSLVCADASPDALNVAHQNVRFDNATFVNCTQESIPYPDGHFDFIFSLGVLHHIPDTAEAIKSLVAKLAPRSRLLLYLYYAFDNRPFWFRWLWKLSDVGRRAISAMSFPLRRFCSELIAAFVYCPLAAIAEYLPVSESWPLRAYAGKSFYTMRTDALDRFGTRLEQRFTKEQITNMLTSAGMAEITFSNSMPGWVCISRKA